MQVAIMYGHFKEINILVCWKIRPPFANHTYLSIIIKPLWYENVYIYNVSHCSTLCDIGSLYICDIITTASTYIS